MPRMDVDAIRSRFIQDNLTRALIEPKSEHAARALRAFRVYYQWFEHRISDLEKPHILGQLARLEGAETGKNSEESYFAI